MASARLCGAAIAALAFVYVGARAEGTTQPLDRLDEGALRIALAQGLAEVKAGKNAEAVASFDAIDQKMVVARAGGARVYCAHSAEESALYRKQAAAGGDALVVDGLWCDAIYYEAYALGNLGRFDEAAKAVDRALTMAPENALYLVERAQLWARERQYDRALEAYRRAEQDLGYMLGEDNVRSVQSSACRGIGSVLTDQGKFDDAEADYRRCLTVDPNDPKSKEELAYIARERANKK